MNYSSCIFLFLCSFLLGFLSAANYRQEHAQLKYCNPKYLKDCEIFTRRASRLDPYLTNVSFTSLEPAGNNFQIMLQFESGIEYKQSYKLCDGFKIAWIKEYLDTFLITPLTKCPVPPGKYSAVNIELPPRNVPLLLKNEDIKIVITAHSTMTGESMFEAICVLHWDRKPKTG